MVEERYKDESIRSDMLGERSEFGGTPSRSVSDVENMRTNLGEGLSSGYEGEPSWKHKSFRDASPDEVREMMKERVAKGIAAFTGALEGFVERSRKGELAQKTRQAIESAGETGREVISSTSEQISQTSNKVGESGIVDNAKQAVKKVGETTRQMTGAVKEETRKTKEELGRGKTNVGAGMGAGSMTSAYNEPSNLGGASELTGLGEKGTVRDMPDIRKTELGTQEDLRKAEGRKMDRI